MADFENIKKEITEKYRHFLQNLATHNFLKNPQDQKQFKQSVSDLESFLDEENLKYCYPLSEEQRRKKREEDIRDWFEMFSIEHEGFFKTKPEFIDNAITVLNQDYWLIINEYIRPFLEKEEDVEHRINFFKIISCTELAIMFRLPVKHEDFDQRVFLNALLAMMTGKHLLSTLNKCGPVSFSNTTAEEEHFQWLQMVVTDASFPYFLNAHTWAYFDTILKLQSVFNEV